MVSPEAQVMACVCMAGCLALESPPSPPLHTRLICEFVSSDLPAVKWFKCAITLCKTVNVDFTAAVKPGEELAELF